MAVGAADTLLCAVIACAIACGDRSSEPSVSAQSPPAPPIAAPAPALALGPLEAYVRDELAALGAAQGVRCAPPTSDRVECALERGGKAFIDVRSDGTTAVEIELDPAAAAARSEPVSPEREGELVKMSRALDDRAPPDAPHADE